MMAASVYFYCRDEEGNFQDDVITIAEGLRELGVPFFGNCNYWRDSPTSDYLIRHDPHIDAADCDVVVVSYTWPHWIRMKTFDLVRRPLPEGLFAKGRRYKTVYMDNHDGYRTISWEPEFREFDLILRSKMNRRMWHPSNMRPWVHGMQGRVLEATKGGNAFSSRQRRLLVNFGASHPFPHGTRTLSAMRFEPAIEAILPIDRTRDDLSAEPADERERLLWKQTGGRHSLQYYDRLNRTQAVACFCGELIPPSPYMNADRYLVRGRKARLQRAAFGLLGHFDSRPWRSVQWDSFRFWESLSAGCAAFNIDLHKYGVEIPEMPENWKHYIGIDFSRIDDAVSRIASDEKLLARVASEGRMWALEHYSPRRMATRFLALLGLDGGKSRA